MKKIVMTMMVIGLTAMVAQAAGTTFHFVETAPGNWEISVAVTGGDSVGLAQYSIWVRNTAGVSYVENKMNTLRAGDFAALGFQPATMLAGYIGPDFNAGNFQGANEFAVQGIGVTPLQIGPPLPFPAPPPYDIDLGVPAHIGTLTTPTGLTLADFDATSANVLDMTGEGVIETFPNVVPEPATLALLGAGSLLLIRRKRR
ncbi:MAG TPA: PEP-CTERM sorting domain-containing protein [Phycisphaerae bacterium]|nr:PEP-CTERM sorting domain-containing protein [Phycisphaerae bacterium]